MTFIRGLESRIIEDPASATRFAGRAPRLLKPGLASRLEGVREVVGGDLRAEGDPGEAGEAVVEASPDARVDDLGSEVVGAC